MAEVQAAAHVGVGSKNVASLSKEVPRILCFPYGSSVSVFLPSCEIGISVLKRGVRGGQRFFFIFF